LVRVSVGAEGYNDNGNAGIGDATIVPAYDADTLNRLGPARGDPTMSNDGAYVFFDSPRGLTPHALDDVSDGRGYAQNVYEWHEGHVYLISDGRDAGSASNSCESPQREAGETPGSAVCLLGTDASGHNVFFTTADQLVSADTDTQVDIYDARICEPENGNPCIAAEPSPLPPCGGEACHGIPPERSPLLTGGSATLNGNGNLIPLVPAAVKPKSLTKAQKLANALKACKKYKKKAKRQSCEASARKKYGAAKKAKKASRDRRPQS
jgi:hypothetical protein